MHPEATQVFSPMRTLGITMHPSNRATPLPIWTSFGNWILGETKAANAYPSTVTFFASLCRRIGSPQAINSSVSSGLLQIFTLSHDRINPSCCAKSSIKKISLQWFETALIRSARKYDSRPSPPAPYIPNRFLLIFL